MRATRYTLAPPAAADYHRPWPAGRAPRDVFCLEYERVVGRDYVVQYGQQALQLRPQARFRVSPKSRVRCERPPRLPKPTPPRAPHRRAPSGRWWEALCGFVGSRGLLGSLNGCQLPSLRGELIGGVNLLGGA
jgi:hypothetical protein